MDHTINLIIALIAIISSSLISGYMMAASRHIWGDKEKERKEAAKLKAALEKIADYKKNIPGEDWQEEAYRLSTIANEALGEEVAHGE